MFIGGGGIFVVGLRALISLLYEINIALDCNEMTRVSMKLINSLIHSALNDVDYYFLVVIFI